MFQAFWQIDDSTLQGGVRDRVFVHGELQDPWSQAFFCPDCCGVWARVRYVDNDGCATTGASFTRHCQEHGNGSLWITWDNDHNRCLPRKLLIREFALAYPRAEGDADGRLGEREDVLAP